MFQLFDKSFRLLLHLLYIQIVNQVGKIKYQIIPKIFEQT